MDVYSKAINKYVNNGDIVLDLGTGTGILSFFAALRKPKKIYAIDTSNIIEKAKLIAKHNGLTSIYFMQKDSKDFDIPEKLDVIIHEQIGHFLFNEGVINKVADVKKRLLKPGGKILPSKFEGYIAPMKVKDEYLIPFLWEQKCFDFSCLKKFKEYSRVHRSFEPWEFDFFLSEPEKVFAFDLEDEINEDNLRRITFTNKLVRDGRLDGFCFFFKVIFDEEIFFSTSPIERITHWKPVLFRCEALECKKEDLIKFDMVIKDFLRPNSWEWSFERIKLQ